MAVQAIYDFRIGEGGLLRRFESATHLTSLGRQIATAVAITWLPVVVFSFVNEWLTGSRAQMVRAPSMHVRLLVATPVLLTLDHVFPRVCRRTLRQLIAQGFVPDAQQGRFDRLLRGATRLADSVLPELIFAAVALGMGIAMLAGAIPTSGLAGRTSLTIGHVWYGIVDQPFLQFLLWRSLWRWAIWVRVLIGLAHLDLDFVAGHADRRGGISFLRVPSIGYCSTLLFAISSVLCADQVRRLNLGVTLASFIPLLIVFGAVGTLVAFGPLLWFTPLLLRVRREAAIQFAGLATECGRAFQRRWPDDRGDIEPPDSRATQPLVDLATVYRDNVDRMRPLLFEGRDMIVLLIATLLPLVPVILMHVPREDWRQLIGLVTGGPMR
jgi:hypothetical protein